MREYGIDFNTLDMGPDKIRYVKVILTDGIMSDTDTVRVDLVDDPLYEKLERYVLNNPSGKAKRK
jgi:hypothetical protein